MSPRVSSLLFLVAISGLAGCDQGQSVFNPLGSRYAELSAKVANAPKAPYGMKPTPDQANQIRDACSDEWARLERTHLAMQEIGNIEHPPLPSASDLRVKCYLDHGMDITGLPR